VLIAEHCSTRQECAIVGIHAVEAMLRIQRATPSNAHFSQVGSEWTPTLPVSFTRMTLVKNLICLCLIEFDRHTEASSAKDSVAKPSAHSSTQPHQADRVDTSTVGRLDEIESALAHSFEELLAAAASTPAGRGSESLTAKEIEWSAECAHHTREIQSAANIIVRLQLTVSLNIGCSILCMTQVRCERVELWSRHLECLALRRQ
jgi:hypothetical protein